MKNKLLITTLTLAALSTAFVGYNSIKGNAETANSNKVVLDASNFITEDEAKKIALDHAGMKESDVTKLKIKLDTEDGVKEYEVEFFSGNMEYDYDINAISGEIMSFDNDVEDDFDDDINDNNNAADSSNLITEDEAKKIALDHAGMKESDVTKLKIKLDTEDGVKEYEVEFFFGNMEYDYDINAISGEIMSFDNDVEDDFDNDMNENSNAADSSKVITEDEAKSIALKDAGIEEADAKSLRIKLDTDDGVKEYEVEFYTTEKEYEYEINANTGKILGKDVESFKNNK